MTAMPAQIKIISTPSAISSLYAAYRLTDADGATKFIGFCKLPQLINMPDAFRNSEFLNVFPMNETVILEVIMLADNEKEAWQIARDHIMREKPVCNIKGVHTYPALFPIICNETGEVFRTIKDVCEAHGVSQSALSNHLSGYPGYKSVKGRTYRRGNPT